MALPNPEFKAIERINDLVLQLNEYRNDYYNHSNSLLTDEEYDKLFDELKALEEQTGYILSSSPTQNVGATVVSSLPKATHTSPMLSLDKVHSVEELAKFKGDKECLMSLKLDGLTIRLTYNHGELIGAETRGDGHIGENITHNIKSFLNVPITIPFKEYIEVEGEAIILKKDFDKINANLPANETPYKNPRNLASGSVRLLDSSEVANRMVRFYVWKVPCIKSNDKQFINKWQTVSFENRLKFAGKLGFTIVPYYIVHNEQTSIKNRVDSLHTCAIMEGIPIDGLVMTYQDVQYGLSLGGTAHHPNHSIAYKFEDEKAETTITEIQWTIGKTGVLTPTAVFEPVEIDGTTVERASVHNVSILEDLDLQIGDKVTVYKANAIIPKIEKNLSLEERNGHRWGIKYPDVCPYCYEPTKLNINNDIKTLDCLNEHCLGIKIFKFSHFVKKECFNIDGLSVATLEKFILNGWLTDYASLFHLKDYRDEIIKLDGFGEKSVDKLLANIEKARNITLDKMLNALSIEGIGKEQSKLLAKHCEYSWHNFMMKICNLYDFSVINGFGSAANDNIQKWSVEDIMYRGLIGEVNLIVPEQNVSSNAFNGMTFVITGSLNSFTNRNEAKDLIESLGGKVSGSVSAKTSYLVNNDIESISSKNKKAKELGIPIITENKLKEMIDNVK